MNMLEEDEEWILYRDSFANDYDKTVMNGSSLQSYVIDCGRRKLESFYTTKEVVNSVLEIGAGTGAHFPFVNHYSTNYCFSDTDEHALEVARKKYEIENHNLSYLLVNLGVLPFNDNQFDRILAVHVLEHMYSPHLVLKEWNRILKPGGIISILIPTDPGILWKFGRMLGPRRRALLRGEPYDYLMARDHVNSCNTLISLIRFYFTDRTEFYWPFNAVPMYDFNLFYIVHCLKKSL